MVNAVINGIPVKVEEGTTILDAAKTVQVQIPTLCKHEDLPPSAACGICVVKIKGNNKMLRACCTPVEEGMDIITNDPEIVDVRRTVIELILSNHPNDCLTCGRNNDCELQTLMANFGIQEEFFDKFVKKTPKDSSTGTVVLEPEKCIKCGRCVEVCQDVQDVWALSFLERGFKTRISPAGDINLADSPCVRCGQCSAHCPTGAIVEYDHTAKVWRELMDPEKYCVVQIAPAVRVSIGEAFGYPPGTNMTKKLYSLLRRLGFKAVFDTNFGADVTIMEEATEFVERFVHKKGALPLITTCCPAWVDFMEKFHSDMIDHFSSCKSPQQIVGALSKTYFAQDKKIEPDKIVMVSIMPCTAKKYEIKRDEEMFASGQQDIDIVLTTRELARMIKQAGIDMTQLPDEEADHVMGDYTGGATIFGATGGVMEAALRTAYFLVTENNLEKVEFENVRGLKGVKETSIMIGEFEIKLAIAHGLSNVEYVLNKVRKAKEKGEPLPYHFIEVMACPGGCIGGGGQPYMVKDSVRIARTKGLYADDEKSKIRCSHDNPFVQKLYNEFLGKPLGKKSHELLHTEYKGRPQYRK
ncbi:MAG: ferredoxin [Omnitrophica bacterium RIFCSPLOWO2_12_FULL_44_17]|uniref:Ferredoxin n=1 Tax=Candidatus Danuiimicrobium aquiferis TaxID=1801832 RepID=A0A1G1L304_9BACT|nr:MAG: ferredoxin [Omnitrophica bacterium RIFCSPHIGHO2_02_FULL_45_28]OGW91821.1 MAG: ferredoxin [Omnitrophica bacterium RIFCSPHIGHO2_12_FULL_44_12]OGW99533.1 MAG: ferredoxin [Omnitrophica bacterium RIFCSPLOWO2_12_FULL_44_17]OGX02704.1 MAG: ferredoxin [Omnitrophica bacterium RIFCSPLOWO2_02_FULL_44_11]